MYPAASRQPALKNMTGGPHTGRTRQHQPSYRNTFPLRRPMDSEIRPGDLVFPSWTWLRAQCSNML